uniref:Uncharacterized protein n=1 Tax=Parascaris equorum TaxID=6256 RepID=A0A914R8X9_PAREQ
MFIEPQQRFTVRKGTTTIGTGVFTTLLPPRTDTERDPKLKKRLMKLVDHPANAASVARRCRSKQDRVAVNIYFRHGDF